MEQVSKYSLSDKKKSEYIDALTPELLLLRTKAEISQEEIANIIGISRQSYGAIERKARKMSWNTFLSRIMFYDYNQKTHKLIRSIGAFPYDIIKHFNEGVDLHDIEIASFLGDGMKTIVDILDEQALRSIRTMIMVEYARCTDTPGDVVIKSFDGKNFTPTQETEVAVAKALKSIKEKNHQQ